MGNRFPVKHLKVKDESDNGKNNNAKYGENCY